MDASVCYTALSHFPADIVVLTINTLCFYQTKRKVPKSLFSHGFMSGLIVDCLQTFMH